MIYLKLFYVFARIGIFGFGGGMAMLPMIYQGAAELGLMSEDEFSDLVGISQITPGPLAVNAATYVGYTAKGLPGALVATLGVALPSFVLVLLVMGFIERFRGNKIIEGAFVGIRPVTVGLIAAAAVFMAKSVIVFSAEPRTYLALAIAAISILLVGKLKVSPIIVVIIAGAFGAILCGQVA